MKATSRLTRVAMVLGIAAIFAPGVGVALAEPPAKIAPKVQCADMKDKEIPSAAIGLPTKGAVITSAKLT